MTAVLESRHLKQLYFDPKIRKKCTLQRMHCIMYFNKCEKIQYCLKRWDIERFLIS